MSRIWQSYSGAPEVGTTLCSLAEVPDEGTHCFEVDGFPVVIVSVGPALRAYVNLCPHQFLPLNYKGDRLISSDRTVLQCTSHGARFSAATGQGVEGLGLNSCLDSIPVYEKDGDVVIGEAE